MLQYVHVFNCYKSFFFHFVCIGKQTTSKYACVSLSSNIFQLLHIWGQTSKRECWTCYSIEEKKIDTHITYTHRNRIIHILWAHNKQIVHILIYLLFSLLGRHRQSKYAVCRHSTKIQADESEKFGVRAFACFVVNWFVCVFFFIKFVVIFLGRKKRKKRSTVLQQFNESIS